jgi:hypothetical protein
MKAKTYQSTNDFTAPQSMKRQINLLAFAIYGIMIYSSCDSNTLENKQVVLKKKEIFQVTQIDVKDSLIKPMSNPVMMKGSNIGCLFNAYYRTGQTLKMIELLDANTKQNFSPLNLNNLLQKLDYGFDMKLSGMKEEGKFKILNYTCLIQQTKVIKQLKVKIENDTARICPKNLAQGIIFQ